eukprot:5098596-Ditylum_brightwellii.AAC.1
MHESFHKTVRVTTSQISASLPSPNGCNMTVKSSGLGCRPGKKRYFNQKQVSDMSETVMSHKLAHNQKELDQKCIERSQRHNKTPAVDNGRNSNGGTDNTCSNGGTSNTEKRERERDRESTRFK